MYLESSRMALGRTSTFAAISVASLLALAPGAIAGTPLPDARTHVDPAGAAADPEAPKLTLLDPDTDAGDIRRGYLYVRARCDVACDLEVTASVKISGKRRDVGTATKTLPANKVRRIKIKVRGSDVRRRIANGLPYRFTAVPLPPL
jgi:hypothetical protein